jgi:hypothetical protein
LESEAAPRLVRKISNTSIIGLPIYVEVDWCERSGSWAAPDIVQYITKSSYVKCLFSQTRMAHEKMLY